MDLISSRGRQVYENEIATQLRPDQLGSLVAIEVNSHDFIVTDDAGELGAVRALRSRHPNPQIHIIRAGARAAHSMGGASFLE